MFTIDTFEEASTLQQSSEKRVISISVKNIAERSLS